MQEFLFSFCIEEQKNEIGKKNLGQWLHKNLLWMWKEAVQNCKQIWYLLNQELDKRMSQFVRCNPLYM